MHGKHNRLREQIAVVLPFVPQYLHCGVYSRDFLDEKSKSPLFPGDGGAMVTNDWCIKTKSADLDHRGRSRIFLDRVFKFAKGVSIYPPFLKIPHENENNCAKRGVRATRL